MINVPIKDFFTVLRKKLSLLINDSAITTWPWYYWIFYFAIVPFILTVIPQLPQLLHQTPPDDILNTTFLLNISNPTISSLFLNHYTHLEINHICANLSIYFLILTFIFFLEKERNIFRLSSFVIFLLLPIVASVFTIIYFQNTVLSSSPFRGFSGIIMAFFGYLMFLLLRLFFNKMKARKTDFLTEGQMVNYYSLQMTVNIIFILFIPVLGCILGAFILNNELVGNGLVHFTGYMSGLLSPTIIGIRGISEFDDKIFLYSIIALIFYSYYLINIHP